ncbi:MAG: helix-turn-helix domain-containing protein [Bacteroidota bacterium]
MTRKTETRSGCPVSLSLDIWGDRWSLLIVRDLMFFDKHTYGEFLESPEKIATNILADRLLRLEETGLIRKDEYPGSKSKYFYRLTAKGIDLLPMMVEAELWYDRHHALKEDFRKTIQQAKRNRTAFLKSMTRKLKNVRAPKGARD